MGKIPQKLKTEILADSFYSRCALYGLFGHVCGGRVTFEHALIVAGKQLNKKFAIIPLCAKAHSVDLYQDGGELDKQKNLWIALNRASPDELRVISKAIDYEREKTRLNALYGVYDPPPLPLSSLINYVSSNKGF